MKIIKLTQIFISIFFFISMEAFSQDYSDITQGVDTISAGGLMGSVYLLNPEAVPIAAGSDGNSGLIYSAAVHYGQGKAFIIGREGALIEDQYDNLTFFENTVKWLNSTNKTVLIKNGWANNVNMSILISKLETEGYTITSTNQKIVSENLTDVGIVIFGNDWNNMQPYTEEEISTIEEFARNGGGVLIAGLGWSYPNSMDDYSTNNIAGIFGLRFGKDVLGDTPYITRFYPQTRNLTVLGSIENLRNITTSYKTDLPEILQNNEEKRYSFTSSNGLLASALSYLPVNNELRDTIYNFYTDLVINYPMYQKGNSFNSVTESAFIWNKEKMHANLRLSKILSNEVINEISSTLGLTEDYLKIWDNHQVMLFDNSKLTDIQLKFTLDILNSIPSEINKIGGISFSDYLGSTNRIQLGSFPMVNTFTMPIGTYPQNQFPNDVSEGITSVFCSAMAHEINHIVDAYYVNTIDKLKYRKEQLINQAGTLSANYLRSIVTDDTNVDYFVQYPQEFFASIANQWFTDSEKVLELGLIRFDNDFKEPINQFLFYADVYSLGSDSTIFYKNDLYGNFSSFKVPIKRDVNENITGIKMNETVYDFQVDNLGNVLNYSSDIEITSTGINPPNNINKIKIYPNPAHTFIIINTGNYSSMFDYSIRVQNMLGQEVFNVVTNEQEFLIDVNSFGGYGMYIVEIRDNSNNIITTRKIILN